jgi:hypothetical protein
LHYLNAVLQESFRTASLVGAGLPHYTTKDIQVESSTITSTKQGCQIFRGPNVPKWEKTYQPQNVANGHKLYQMAVKYSKWS